MWAWLTGYTCHRRGRGQSNHRFFLIGRSPETAPLIRGVGGLTPPRDPASNTASPCQLFPDDFSACSPGVSEPCPSHAWLELDTVGEAVSGEGAALEAGAAAGWGGGVGQERNEQGGGGEEDGEVHLDVGSG